jgi:hypothetical protein
MSNPSRDESRLAVELAQLRAALRDVEAPTPDDTALRARFRDVQRLRAQKLAVVERAGGRRRVPLAAAAAVVLAVGGVLAAVALRGDRQVPVRVAAEPPAAEPLAVAAFQPLLTSRSLSPSSAYSVVRVRIPLSAFAVVPGTEQDGSIEADLLVGEDGLARAIRFNDADALLVSVANQ